MRFRRVAIGEDPRRTLIRIAVLGTIVLATFTWVLVPVRAQGISMLPTYRSGSLLFVFRLAYLHRAPARGDVVAIRLAGPRVVYVKRIVALPRERVAVRDGVVHVNGAPLREPYVVERARWNVPEAVLGAHEYFVVGDNRAMASADHAFGRVDASRILGRVAF